jgi:hypothetical protein
LTIATIPLPLKNLLQDALRLDRESEATQTKVHDMKDALAMLALFICLAVLAVL